jgi:Holliday junction resolvase-like predicted endonuclease
MSNYATGHEAEKVAADYLARNGYTVIECNWRHKRAEIDIVAQKKHRFRSDEPLTFFEVKHRKTDYQGRGLDYITPKKLQQMRFAAQLYVAIHKTTTQYKLGAVELAGVDYQVTNVLDDIS